MIGSVAKFGAFCAKLGIIPRAIGPLSRNYPDMYLIDDHVSFCGRHLSKAAPYLHNVQMPCQVSFGLDYARHLMLIEIVLRYI